MSRHAVRLLRRCALMLGFFAGLAPGAANAGLVTGAWDPPFGSFLPGLSWAVRAELLMPNGCSNQPDGVYSTGDCAQANITVQNVWLRFYDTGFADPDDFFQLLGGFPDPGVDPVRSTYFAFGGGAGFDVTSVRVQAQQVVGFDLSVPAFAQTLVDVSSVLYSFPSSAGGNLFGLSFDVNGPVLECLNCRQDIDDPFGASSVFAGNAGLKQFLITYISDDMSAPKFTLDGEALGARLDEDGVYLGQSTGINAPLVAVPEPGVLALALTALAALGVARRRRG